MIETHAKGKQPFEIVILGGSAAACVAFFLTDKLPPSILVLPETWQITWAILFFLGNVAALAGVLMKDEVAGLFWEAAGLFPSAFMAWAYAAAILYRVDDIWVSYYSASFFFTYGLACLWRWYLIRRTIRRIKRM